LDAFRIRGFYSLEPRQVKKKSSPRSTFVFFAFLFLSLFTVANIQRLTGNNVYVTGSSYVTTPPCPPGSTVITVLDDSFDSVTPPTLPGWTATNAIDPDGIFWQSSNTGLPSPPADSPPNATWINDPAVGGTFVTGGYNSTIATGTGGPLAAARRGVATLVAS
jgi:hypothetical protein